MSDHIIYCPNWNRFESETGMVDLFAGKTGIKQDFSRDTETWYHPVLHSHVLSFHLNKMRVLEQVTFKDSSSLLFLFLAASGLSCSIRDLVS